MTGAGSGGEAEGDTLTGIENVRGGYGDDQIIGDNHDNLLSGDTGNDILQGAGGNDTLKGGAGKDTLDGGVGIDTADYSGSHQGVIVNLAAGIGSGGEADGDVLISIENLTGSGSGANTLIGNDQANIIRSVSAGNDELSGMGGADELYGGDGEDYLSGGAGSDLLDGGYGEDTASYSESTAAVQVNLLTGIGIGGDAEGDSLVSIENVIGSAYNDVLTGDLGNNSLTGGAGNDSLRGDDGDDTLYGGVGNDYLRGGEGADVLDGGEGRDSVDYSQSTSGVEIDLAAGTAAGGSAAGDTFNSIENVYGSAYADILTGNDENNTLLGRDGDDHLLGGVGNDLWFYATLVLREQGCFFMIPNKLLSSDLLGAEVVNFLTTMLKADDS
jgi:Ca2+-binding RTX toxin-like protein